MKVNSIEKADVVAFWSIGEGLRVLLKDGLKIDVPGHSYAEMVDVMGPGWYQTIVSWRREEEAGAD